MRIVHIDISNFRKLSCVRIDLEERTTLFVGPNNSGKTSAMEAVRRFLLHQKDINLGDFPISHWPRLEKLGSDWETGYGREGFDVGAQTQLLQELCPALDLWLNVKDGEIHHVAHLIPTLDWQGGLLGIRLTFEPKDFSELVESYLKKRHQAQESLNRVEEEHRQHTANLRLWPDSLLSFLQKELHRHFVVRAYTLDPSLMQPPAHGCARPQVLPADHVPVSLETVSRLIRVDEINAQRGLGGDDGNQDSGAGTNGITKKLSGQMRDYYRKHLNPLSTPSAQDLIALGAVDTAQTAFNERLRDWFCVPLSEVENLGYPGVSDPRIEIATSLLHADGLNHEPTLHYYIDGVETDGSPLPQLRLPEDSLGLGYQNLISMIFRLMSFRDGWLKIGSAAESQNDIPPLHLVLIEEPEAHLHAQVQQVFINKAYGTLRSHSLLGSNEDLSTQLLVSTHSNHIAHELPFGALRYFRRYPAGKFGKVPTSRVINLCQVFGELSGTRNFVTRYLRLHHSDLFFADAAILVEGPAERILLPSFIRNSKPFLEQCYLCIMEINGNHAHKLRPLIEQLGLTTLVITDLDACVDRKAVPPKRGDAQKTSNYTLASWLPGIAEVDGLLDANEASMELPQKEHSSCVRVAFQQEITTTIFGNQQTITPGTFEDALAYTNIESFRTLKGDGLITKFQDVFACEASVEGVEAGIFEALRKGDKADFALQMLEANELERLKVPAYIETGLDWLQTQLKRKQAATLFDEVIEPSATSHYVQVD